MVAEEMVIVLSGGGPWGFRLQGGLEQQKTLQVAKVSEQPWLVTHGNNPSVEQLMEMLQRKVRFRRGDVVWID